ncbi:MAG TPA: amino acid ABC transporter permease, partial [Clostridiales bacterium]|nr:amino acid ABC transporter permease [Clostridiales bacterium]
MQDLGIQILFEGNNFVRLLGGLWITVKTALTAVVISLVLGILM